MVHLPRFGQFALIIRHFYLGSGMGNIIGVLIVIYLVHRSIETIPPGEHLDYLLLEHTVSNRSAKPDLLPVPENRGFFRF